MTGNEQGADIISMRLRIEGGVQGVGFREFTISEANALNLKGWVRNRADGTVEALACGPRHDVEALIAKCMKGPPSARVTSVDLSPADPPDRLGFTRRPTV